MPSYEPSEDAIWAMIDEDDPRGDARIVDRLERHAEMLEGRDVYRNFFVRSPLLPEYSSDIPVFENFPKWVTSEELKCSEYIPLENTVGHISFGMRDILQPAIDSDEPKGYSNVLGYRQLSSTLLEWPRNSSLGRISSPPNGYVVWARYVLRTHRVILKSAGVYEAIYASMFDYATLPPSWVRSAIEFWDIDRNTCWFGQEECTITLWELQAVSGLPIFGHRYEECIPPDEQIFRRQPSLDGCRRGEMILPLVYHELLTHYRRIHKDKVLKNRSRVTIDTNIWIASFIREDMLLHGGATLDDPFCLGLCQGDQFSEETAEPSSPLEYPSHLLSDVSENLSLAGFIVTWICTFVLPIKEGTVRSSALLAASRISRGDRISLAPALLARIYKIFGTISEAKSLETFDLTLPWQYIHAWIHLHVYGAFSCSRLPSYFSERGYPVVMQLSHASSTLERERLRLFFFAPYLVTDRFRFIRRPEIVGIPPHLVDIELADGVDQRGRPTLFYNSHSLRVVEYFVSMRPAWLCCRLGNTIILEGYQPSRVARQFGFSQMMSYDKRPFIPGITNARDMSSVPKNTKFQAASLLWFHLLRLGTGSTFRIAGPDSYSGVSYHYLMWVRHSFGPYMEHGVRRYMPPVRLLGIPRGMRPPRRAVPAADDRDEVHTTEAPRPSRVRSRDSSPTPTEMPSPVRQRTRSPCAESSKAREDLPFSPLQVDTSWEHSYEATLAAVEESSSTLHDRSSHPPCQGDILSEHIPEVVVPEAEDQFMAPKDLSSELLLEVELSTEHTLEATLAAVEEPFSISHDQSSHPLCQGDISSEPVSEVVVPKMEELLIPSEDTSPELLLQEDTVSDHTPEILSFEVEGTSLAPSHPMETSEVRDDLLDRDLMLVVHVSDIAELPQREGGDVPESSSNHGDIPFPELREGDFLSTIPCRIPSAFYSRYRGILEVSLASLRDTILLLHPAVPESLEHFTALANDMLDILARLGIDETELRFWESVCRGVEYLVTQLQRLTTWRSRTSLEHFRRLVTARRVAVDAATDDVHRSTEVLQRHRARSVGLRAEIESLTSQIDTFTSQIDVLTSEIDRLQTETTSAVLRRSQLEREFQRETGFIRREQRLYQLRHSTFTGADAALTLASDALYAAETEQRSFRDIVSQFDTLLARLS